MREFAFFFFDSKFMKILFRFAKTPISTESENLEFYFRCWYKKENDFFFIHRVRFFVGAIEKKKLNTARFWNFVCLRYTHSLQVDYDYVTIWLCLSRSVRVQSLPFSSQP